MYGRNGMHRRMEYVEFMAECEPKNKWKGGMLENVELWHSRATKRIRHTVQLNY